MDIATMIVATDANIEEPAQSANAPVSASELPSLPRGTLLGRYMVIEMIGSGGLGQVYAAYDPHLERQVAIKVLRHDLGERSRIKAERMHERLLREAQALARLSHPNVVAVHDVGMVDEMVFIAMEKVEGLTLSKWRKQSPKKWQEIRDTFAQAGVGLAVAHRQNIVHRDFKPANVLVSADGRVRVLDFGLARATQELDSLIETDLELDAQPRENPGLESELDIDPSTSGIMSNLLETELTQMGTVLGTPAYMAPEQLRAAASVGAAADQFAFCVALWEALYEQRPFPNKGDLGERLRRIERGLIQRPGDTRGVPTWLQRALMKGMAAKPEDRFVSMDALLVALDRDRLSRRRNYWLLAGVAGLSAMMSAGTAIFFRPEPTAQEQDVLEMLAGQAVAAAARSYYVYPPPDRPELPTAYRKVLELEAQEGTVEDLADRRAAELRREFADTLVRLGDKYWLEEGGKPFAIDYYAGALMFDPTRTVAQERAMVSRGELALLREKASEGAFSEAELVAAEPLAVLAEPDVVERKNKLAKIYKRRDATSSTTSARLERVLRRDPKTAPVLEDLREKAEAQAKREERSRPEVAPPPAVESPPEDPLALEPEIDAAEPLILDEEDPVVASGDFEAESEVEVDVEVEVDPVPVRKKRRRARSSDGAVSAHPSSRVPNEDLAASHVAQGQAALRRGDFTVAETLFHRALGYSPRHVPAFQGLCDVYFEIGAYPKSLHYAKLAAEASPTQSELHILLGDAYFKVHAYADARRAYERARTLGNAQAADRLDLLTKRIGEQ